jgi:hypothetical protein
MVDRTDKQGGHGTEAADEADLSAKLRKLRERLDREFAMGGALHGWLGGQTAQLQHQIQVSSKALLHLGDVDIQECETWLKRAHRCLSPLAFGYSRYDVAWSSLREIRHKFCCVLKAKELDRIAQEISYDLDYVADETERKRHKEKLGQVQEKLLALAQQDEPSKEELRELRESRVRLASLSVTAAIVRQAQWHKLNLLRARLAITGLVLFVVTVIFVTALYIWPALLGPDQTDRSVIGVIGFGALGGLLSSLRQQEPLVGTSAVFYMERGLLFLRPLVGATAALILYLAQLSGSVKFELLIEPAGFYFLAFCAGFSEQFFLRHLTSVLTAERTKDPEAKTGAK